MLPFQFAFILNKQGKLWTGNGQSRGIFTLDMSRAKLYPNVEDAQAAIERYGRWLKGCTAVALVVELEMPE